MPNWRAIELLESCGLRLASSRASEICFRKLTFEKEIADHFLECLIFSPQTLQLRGACVRIIKSAAEPPANRILREIIGLRHVGD